MLQKSGDSKSWGWYSVVYPIIYREYIHNPRWLALGFLNHQQYVNMQCHMFRHLLCKHLVGISSTVSFPHVIPICIKNQDLAIWNHLPIIILMYVQVTSRFCQSYIFASCTKYHLQIINHPCPFSHISSDFQTSNCSKPRCKVGKHLRRHPGIINHRVVSLAKLGDDQMVGKFRCKDTNFC